MSGVRFAPSPTGRFHVGNLRTAWISKRWAEELGLPWVVRFEDIDAPRVIAGAQDRQLADLRSLGLVPDQVLVQSASRARHLDLFERARSEGAVYPCTCSRKDVQDALLAMASAPHSDPAIYNGACRSSGAKSLGTANSLAWRFKSGTGSGEKDFIVARTDGAASSGSFAPAYHWACAIDDWDGRYELLVRAWDLASATPLQREIHEWLGRADPAQAAIAVYHSALVLRDDGGRLEKRTLGVTWDELFSQGYSAEKLLAGFQASWPEGPRDFASGRVWGEVHRSIGLKALGLKLDLRSGV